jgi:hypothetical protein
MRLKFRLSAALFIALQVITQTVALSANGATPLKIIDAHTHTNFTGEIDKSGGMPRTQEEYFKEMKEAGVVGAIAHVMTSSPVSYQDLRSINVFHCAGVGEKIDIQDVEQGLKSTKYSCIKIYLGYVHRFAYDSAYEPIYQLAKKYGVPVVFHTGDTYSTRAKVKFSDPLTVDEVAVDHPDITFVIAHAGNPWIESAAEVAYKNPNVYLDGSAFVIGDIKKLPKERLESNAIKPLKWIFNYIEDPNKLMFGTDWPLVKMGDYVEVFKKAIPKEYWNKVFYENAVKVFKLKLTPGEKKK